MAAGSIPSRVDHKLSPGVDWQASQDAHRMTVTHATLPLFPLGTVLYPQGLMPLRIFEARYIDMVSASLRNSSPFGIVPLLRGGEVGRAADFHQSGTLATIAAWDQGPDGLLHIQIEGGDRFRIDAHTRQTDGLIIGEVETLAPASDSVIPQQFAYLSNLLREVFEQNRGQVPYESWQLDSALWVGHRLAEVLPLDMSNRIALLEASSGVAKLGMIDVILGELKGTPPSSAHH